MSTMIQIRHVPNELHRKLKARAAAAGRSLSDYLLDEIHRVASLPTPEELAERIRRRRPMLDGPSSAEMVRAIREGR